MATYSVLLTPDPIDGGYTVSVPALPGCFTQGETVEESLSRAAEVVALYLEDLAASGEPVPEETTPPQVLSVTVAAA